MYLLFIPTLLFFLMPLESPLMAASLSLTYLRCEYKVNPIGIDTDKPRLSWNLISEKRAVKQARLYITSLGLYEAEMNGRLVGNQLFTPGWACYDDRLQYQTYDVTSLLKKGPNAVGVTLGDGWYRGGLIWDASRNIYGQKAGIAHTITGFLVTTVSVVTQQLTLRVSYPERQGNAKKQI